MSMAILRLIHILAGVFWAGTVFFVVVFLEPTIAAAGAEGGRFMQRLATQTRLSMALGLAGGLTTLSGVAMYWRVSGGLQPAWIGTRTGLALTISGLAAILAAIPGGMTGATQARMRMLASEVVPSGAPPSPAHAAQIQTLQARAESLTRWTAVLLLVAVSGMAVARYL